MSDQPTIPAGGALCPSCGAVLTDSDETCSACAVTRGPAQSRPAYGGPRWIAGFEILREIGAGGMGTVLEAHDTRMKRRVALKVMSRHHSTTDKADVRFAREAWIGGKLTHPNLVRVYERGEWEELSYISMELVEGGALDSIIHRMKQWGKDESLGLEVGTPGYMAWAISQMITAARALDHAHRSGVVHRDIKPQNILFDRTLSTVKVADFGLAVDLAASTRLTTAGKVFGSVAYMAPEQIRGDLDAIDQRTDVYSLGVTLYEMLTLELPYAGRTQQLYMNAVLTSEVRPPRKLNERVGRDLEIVLKKALEKRPEDRYTTAGDFADDLQNVISFQPIRARPVGWPLRVFKWARRRPNRALAAGLLGVGLPLVGVMVVTNLRDRAALVKVEVQELIRQGDRFAQQARRSEAIAAYTRAIERDVDNTTALRKRAVVHTSIALQSSDPPEAALHVDRAVDDIDRIIEVLPRESWPYQIRSFLNRRFGDEKAAEDDMESANRNNGNEDSDLDLAVAAQIALVEGDYKGSIDLNSKLLERQPGALEAVESRAMAYERLGDIESAIDDWRFATALAPMDPHPHSMLAAAYDKAGEHDTAEGTYRRSLELEDDPRIRVNLAENMMQQALEEESPGRAQAGLLKAETEARRSIELDPSIPEGHLNLGIILIERFHLSDTPRPGLVTEAIASYRRALEEWKSRGHEPRDPVFAYANLNLCDALIQAGRLNEALSDCRQATVLDPDEPITFYNLAGVYAMLGRPDEAFEALEEDVALGDTDWEYLVEDEWFVSLREDPRFEDLVVRMKKASGS